MGLYLSFMVSAAAAGTLAVRGPFDVLYASSPPLLVGAAALAIRARWRVPLVFEVADLWPASAVAVGELRRPGAIRLAEWLERKCYGRAAHIVVASEGMRDALAARGVPPEKLSVIFNGADTLRFTPQPEAADHLRRRLGLEGTTVVLYAGLHGLAQGLEVVLDAADRLRERRHIRLLLIGEGPTKSALIEAAHRRGLDNVVFHPGVAPEEMPAFFSLAQVALVPVRAHPVFDTVLPMKLFESWACACPTIVGVGGEARALVERAQAGVAVEPENAAALAAAISALAAAPERCRQLGVNGRRFVESRFSRQSQVDRLCELLARVSGERM
jgi:glycosyltransferase involved in cell wall biosynthesis